MVRKEKKGKGRKKTGGREKGYGKEEREREKREGTLPLLGFFYY